MKFRIRRHRDALNKENDRAERQPTLVTNNIKYIAAFYLTDQSNIGSENVEMRQTGVRVAVDLMVLKQESQGSEKKPEYKSDNIECHALQDYPVINFSGCLKN